MEIESSLRDCFWRAPHQQNRLLHARWHRDMGARLAGDVQYVVVPVSEKSDVELRMTPARKRVLSFGGVSQSIRDRSE